MFSIAPFELARALVNATQRNGHRHTDKDLVCNPLIALQAKDAAVSNPPIVRCLLQALTLYLNSSKTQLSVSTSVACAAAADSQVQYRYEKHWHLTVPSYFSRRSSRS